MWNNLAKFASAVVLAACLGTTPAQAVIGPTPPTARAPLELIVTYNDAAPAEAQVMADVVGAQAVDRLSRLPRIRIVRFSAEAALEQARQQLLADPAVATVERAELVHAELVPSDPLYPQQWALPLMRAPAAWDIETGDPAVLVLVVDSMLTCSDHPDLAPNCRQDLARNFSTNTALCDHGRHVAGIAAAALNNGVNVAGVAGRGVGIVPARFLAGTGCAGSTAGALQAWNYALELAAAGHEVVVNNSWGGGGFSQAFQDAAAAMKGAGVVNTAAAGNGGTDKVGDNICATPVYPASYAHVLTVAATETNDVLTPFSNFGVCPGSVEVAAPGRDILSTCAGSTTCLKSGTSMADPFVAGLAALLLSQNRSLSVDQVVQRIVDGVTPKSLPVTSGGRIDLAAPLGPPVPGITVSLICPSQEVNQAATLNCTAKPVGKAGYTGAVALTCSGLPCTVSPSTVQTGQSATVAVKPTTSTTVGKHTLKVNAVSGSHTALAQTQLEVFPAGTTTVSGTSTEMKPLGRACFSCPFVQVAETRITITPNLRILRVSGTATVRWTFPGQVKLTLIPPPAAGAAAVVIRPSGTQGAITNWPWVIESALDGKPSAGQWTLRAELTSTIGSGNGGLDRWSITIKGPPF